MWTQTLQLFFQGRRKRRSPPRKNKPMYSHRTLNMSEWQIQIYERPRHTTFMDLSLLLGTFYENWLRHICEHWRKVHLTWSNCDARPLSEPIYYEYTFAVYQDLLFSKQKSWFLDTNIVWFPRAPPIVSQAGRSHWHCGLRAALESRAVWLSPLLGLRMLNVPLSWRTVTWWRPFHILQNTTTAT